MAPFFETIYVRAQYIKRIYLCTVINKGNKPTKKMKLRYLAGILLAAAVMAEGCYSRGANLQTNNMDTNKTNIPQYSRTDTGKVVLNDDELKKTLPSDIYRVARQKGTE